ncbi:NADH-quinone oxidoreductase subunit C [Streptomyces katrae]|uniref:NADH-quinone oxidoreductase subunit C n=1 Tax=Streptomyces katrae TaxID=68223 RepID=UPI0007C4AD9C|nr:NADH-quinone oxidoreductase subunit C [Streptomyces katrae]
MNLYDSLPDAAATVFGAEAVASSEYEVLTVDVPAGSWIPSLEIARDKLGCTYFDWLSAVDEPGTGFRICAHVVSLENRRVRRLLLRTTVPHSAPSLPSAVAIYAGAEWHERETYEMFGVVFTDHPHLAHLLLPENFEGHPLRKDFVLAARVAKAWPGAKEPGEAHDPDAPKRRQMLPPGVPDPNDWGPLKGQLPPAPTRPARTARAPREGAPARRSRPGTDAPATPPAEAAATPEAAAVETPRPARRTRTASDGSASQAVPPAEAQGDAPAETQPAAPRPARRTRTASDGSASQAVPPAEAAATPAAPPAAAPAEDAPQADDAPRPARRARSAADGSASQAAAGRTVAPGRRPAPRSTDAPWHNPQPAFADQEQDSAPAPAPEPKPGSAPAADRPGPKAEPKSTPKAGPRPEAEPKAPAPGAAAPGAADPGTADTGTADPGAESAAGTGHTPESESDNGGDA